MSTILKILTLRLNCALKINNKYEIKICIFYQTCLGLDVFVCFLLKGIKNVVFEILQVINAKKFRLNYTKKNYLSNKTVLLESDTQSTFEKDTRVWRHFSQGFHPNFIGSLLNLEDWIIAIAILHENWRWFLLYWIFNLKRAQTFCRFYSSTCWSSCFDLHHFGFASFQKGSILKLITWQ